jgi:hypothetical protein
VRTSERPQQMRRSAVRTSGRPSRSTRSLRRLLRFLTSTPELIFHRFFPVRTVLKHRPDIQNINDIFLYFFRMSMIAYIPSQRFLTDTNETNVQITQSFTTDSCSHCSSVFTRTHYTKEICSSDNMFHLHSGGTCFEFRLL